VAPRQRYFPLSISWNLFRISDFKLRIFSLHTPVRSALPRSSVLIDAAACRLRREGKERTSFALFDL
jgi:hypothetical protein